MYGQSLWETSFGRSRSKLELMSYPSFFLVFIRGLKILRKGKQSSLPRKKKKGLLFFFFFFLLSIELKIWAKWRCWNLDTWVLLLCRRFYPTANGCRTVHLFGLSLSAEWSGLRHVGIYSEQLPKISSHPSWSHFFSCPFLGRKEETAGLSGAMPEGSLLHRPLPKHVYIYLRIHMFSH